MRPRPALAIAACFLAQTASLAIAALLVAVASPATALESEPMYALLKGGRHVVLIRHAITTPGVGDPPGMRLDDCRTQRNLTDDGRRQARQIGEAFRVRGIPVDRVMTSPWCRCVETARLAFGAAEVDPALSNLYGRPENRTQQVADMRALLDEHRGAGTLVLVTHGSTIAALTGVSPDSGEMIVVMPQSNGRFAVVGRLTAHGP